MVLMIDNYDSFTYNLYQAAAEIMSRINPGSAVKVTRNDKITTEEIRRLNPSHIIISPGPRYPSQAGICEETIKEFADECKILGVCLGHQAICEAFGAEIIRASELMHGKQSDIILEDNVLFKGMPKVIKGARDQSLAAKKETLPEVLKVTARDPKGEIMGVQVKGKNVFGVQFHPESILTPDGPVIIENFLKL